MNPILVKAPSTTANMGPGFDCLGMALDLWNEITVIPLDNTAEGALVEVTGEGSGELAADENNLVYKSMEFLFKEASLEIPSFKLLCNNQIPLKRGLGSSAAAIAGGLVAANAMCDDVFSKQELLEMAATIEGHPDNVAAAVLGGLQLVVSDGPQIYTASIPVPDNIQAVIFVPEFTIATDDARRVLPDSVSRQDAIFNMGRLALLISGMGSNHPEYLSVATEDKIHQPYRQSLFPAMKLIFNAARAASALGVFLSGSGPTILALANEREMTIAYEMFDAARQADIEGKVDIVGTAVSGAYIEK
jgi:homoserine kinase